MRDNPFDRLPDTVEIGGRPVRIDPDFRIGVQIETELLHEQPDVPGLLLAFYPDGVPDDLEEAADRMIWFYAHTDMVENGTSNAPKGAGRRWYDFAQDADALTASFRQAYGIDLERERLHWWKFRRLMFGLPPDTPFMRRVHYRTADASKLPKSERKHYREMKALYALEQPETRHRMTAAEREADMKARLTRRFEEVQHAAQG